MFEHAVAGISQTRDTTSSPVQFAGELGKCNYRDLLCLLYIYIYIYRERERERERERLILIR